VEDVMHDTSRMEYVFALTALMTNVEVEELFLMHQSSVPMEAMEDILDVVFQPITSVNVDGSSLNVP